MNGDTPGNRSDATVREFASGQKLFNRYTLVKILGRGGMGIVWLARDEELERDVALKFLPDLIIHDRAALGDLKRETRRSLELTHRNIVRIYDFVHDNVSGCISMEYVDGDTLSNLRADKPRKVFEPDELTDWISQLCDALDYAHTHARIVHRDLKPANLMVNQRGDLKVADFGIARSLSDSVSKVTMQHGKSGTLVYMSPQQLDGERGNHLDDVYSLGASIYELLTSKPPFDRQIHERIPPPMNHRREELEIEGEPIDETWEKLVATCLRKDPARRPQSTTEIVASLGALPKRQSGWLKFPTSHKTPETTHKTRNKAEPPRTKRVREKKFRLAVARTIAAANEKFRGAALAVISASEVRLRGAGRAFFSAAKGIFRAAVAVTALSANILIAAGGMLLVLTKETVRGAALVVIPAAAVAACISYLSNRPPHPESKSATTRVAQETPKTSPPQAAPEQGTPNPKAFARSRFEMAHQALQQYDLATARTSIDQADAADPNNPSILNLRGEILLGQKEFELAEATFKKALEIDPKFREAQDNLAQLRKEKQRSVPAAPKIIANTVYEGTIHVKNGSQVRHDDTKQQVRRHGREIHWHLGWRHTPRSYE